VLQSWLQIHIYIQIQISVSFVYEDNASSREDSTSEQSSPIQDLALAQNELMQMQQSSQTPLQLDTHFQLPKFFRHINGEAVDS